VRTWTRLGYRLNQPFGVAVDGAGTVYVADSLNHLISQGVTAGVPNLLVRRAGSGVMVLWPNTGSCTLEQNSSVANALGWTVSGYPITTANSTSSITITPPMGNLFFRLRQ
jgi:hypothetical protein